MATDQWQDAEIDEDQLRNDLVGLCRIASISGSAAEPEIQRFLARTWRDEGLDVDEWDIDVAALSADPEFPGSEVERRTAVGVTATLGAHGPGPTLLLNGHTDVVPVGDRDAWTTDPFEPRLSEVDGDRVVVARGSADMKAGVAAMWAAVRAVQRSGIVLRGRVVMAAVSGEEDGGLGTFALLRRGITADLCVITEPTGLAVIPANGGALTFRLVVRGRAAHASRRTEGVSAIDAFLPVLAALHELERRRNAVVDPLMQRWPIAYPISIGTVRGGDWPSSVPDRLVAEGRLGVALDESEADARAGFEAAVFAACRQDPWLAAHPVEVEWWGGQFASGRTPADSAVISAVCRAHEDVTGSAPEVYGAPYGSDLRLLTRLGAIPTVQYGPGGSEVAHAPDEQVSLREASIAARVLARIIVDVCA